MTKELTVKKEDKKPAPYTQDQIDLIKRTVAKDATNDELKLFLIVAARSGLDPFSRQIHFVKRKGQGTFQTGIDGYRAIAERSNSLAGIDDAVYDSEDKLQPEKASVTVYRLIGGIRVPFTASARWNEYKPSPPNDFMWNKMPYLMLGKVAEALALRKAFPNDLSGLYTHEEMAQADGDQTPATIDTAVPTQPAAPQEPVQLGDVALDFITHLEAATTVETYMQISKAIQEANSAKALTQAEFGEIVKVAKKTVGRIEAQKTPPPVVEAEIVEPKNGYERAKAAVQHLPKN